MYASEQIGLTQQLRACWQAYDQAITTIHAASSLQEQQTSVHSIDGDCLSEPLCALLLLLVLRQRCQGQSEPYPVYRMLLAIHAKMHELIYVVSTINFRNGRGDV